jgi:hypothetical protein
LRRLA